MTNEQLDRWLAEAENVMGWILSSYSKLFWHVKTGLTTGFSNSKVGGMDNLWHPTTSIEQAMMCAEKLRLTGYKITLWGNPPEAVKTDSGGKAGYHCRIIPYGQGMEKSIHAKTPELAICKAIYEALNDTKE